MKRIVILVLFCLLNIKAANSQQASVRPTDFNFVFSDGVYVLDTLKGSFTRDADQPKVAVSIDLKLTPVEMDEVFRGLERIDFWNGTKYPTVFSFPPPLIGQRGRLVIPYPAYLFTVTSKGQAKELSWKDNILEPTYPPADELRGIFQAIRRIIESKPEYKALPPSRAFPRI